MTQKEYFGSIDQLTTYLQEEQPKKIFLVTGKSSFTTSGAQEKIIPLLTGYKVIHFTDFSPNPKLEDVEKGLKCIDDCDLVIAVGGGSAMDMAKLVGIFSTQEKVPAEYITGGEKVASKQIPLIAIPTTAGSGSEATHFAVVYIDKTKYSVADQSLTPDYVIVDSSLTMSLPKPIAAATGMDAFAQAVEGYWSINSTDESKAYSREAIELLVAHLEKAVNENDAEAKANVARAANLAGKAINIAKTTASHAVSYPITSYFGVAHGHAAALILGEMLKYNAEITPEDTCNDKRGIDYVKGVINELVDLLGLDSVQNAPAWLDNFMTSIGLATRLSEVGITTDEDINIIIAHGFNPARVKNNPRFLTEDELRAILMSKL